MTAILKFNLNDPDDNMAHQRCIKSLDMALALWDFSGKLRQIVDTSEDGKWIDEDVVWRAWNEILEEHNLNINNLIM
jgi:hypothetical protein